MTRRDPEPGTGSAFMGAAAASFATGPTLILTYGIYAMLADPAASDMDARELGTLGTLIGFSSVICLIGSIPAATFNAIALNHLVHRERDAVWWAMTSGAIVGLLVALIMSNLTDSTLHPTFALWFSATGALMGWLHWLIAIRPRRRWRLWLLHDQEAIRAME